LLAGFGLVSENGAIGIEGRPGRWEQAGLRAKVQKEREACDRQEREDGQGEHVLDLELVKMAFGAHRH
jgi:hypothetical protein